MDSLYKMMIRLPGENFEKKLFFLSYCPFVNLDIENFNKASCIDLENFIASSFKLCQLITR